MAVVIRPLAASERAEVLAVVSRAFWHDPLADFFSRDLLHEYRLLPLVFAPTLDELRRPGGHESVAEHEGRPRAYAGWLEPGTLPRSNAGEARRALRSLPGFARFRQRTKAIRLLLEVDRHHPREPHWYLALLATDPSAQGRGLASALLAPVLERCDREGTLAYLETQKEANVSWYARAGFTVDRKIALAGTPPIWCLRREPKG
jgi:GNAT superfamily N-acetyltransferase